MIIRQHHIVWVALLMTTIVDCGHSQDATASSPGAVAVTKVVKGGSPVILECKVTNSGTNQVSWKFLSHNFVIYQGGLLMTDNPTKYSIIRPPDSSAYNLQILEVEKSDQGFYECHDGTSQESTVVHLDVIEKIDSPLNAKPGVLNRTECCVSFNISETCHPACVPSTIDDNFDPVFDCGLDGTDGLVNLVHCLTAGSNHENCCLFRGVDPMCVPFCRNEMPDDLGLQHVKCLDNPNFDILLACSTEGFATLPNEPQSVSVIPHNDGKMSYIIVSWKPPTRNADKITGYKIMYKRNDLKEYFSVVLDSPIARYTRLSGLNILPNRGYDVHVAALAEHGASGASVEVSIFIPDTSLNDDQNQNINACCEDRRVSEKCRSKLCQSKTWSKLDVDFLSECLDSLDDVFTCLVGERDHSSCCSAFEVASVCVPICSGHPPPFNSSLIVCAQQLAIIEACVQQGYENLPAPPNHLELQTVLSDSATLTFQPSPSVDVKRIVILLKAGEMSDAKFIQWGSLDTSEGTFALTNLIPDTYYSVHLAAETDSYGSLPSETLHFLTYPDSQPTIAPVTNVPHNFTECCFSKGMPAICAIGCKYVQNISAHYGQHLKDCYSHIGTVLSCGADGRDHAECCARRNVTDPDCLNLCGIASDGPLDENYVKCLMDTPKAVACFEEGLISLPRYPDAYVSAVTQNTISLMWIHPPTSSKIDNYIVEYRPAGKVRFTQETTTSTHYILQHLLPSTEYEITVKSDNGNGTSSPSPVIRQFTNPANDGQIDFNRTDVSGRQYWANITECCHSSGIPDNCIDQCLNKQTSALDANKCIFHSHKMLACYADGQDHGECCRESPGLPSTCVAICSGHTMELTVSTAVCMGHGYKDIIFSCYMKNSGLIPDPPLNTYVKLKEAMKVQVVWTKPTAFCGDDCQSIIHYWREDPKDPGVRLDVKTKIDVTSPYDLTVTGPEGRYTFTVTARNTYGSSPPSSLRTVFVSPFSKDVKVSLRSNVQYVETGENAVLQCAATDFNPSDPYTIQWLFNDKLVLTTTSSSGHQLYLNAVDPKKDEGSYSCVVKDSTIEVKDSLFLSIKYAPDYDDNRDETVAPGEGKQAKVACWFNGFPDTGAENWKKDGIAIRYVSTKYSAQVDKRYHTGITSYRLKIANVVREDYGMYTIEVRNKYGKSSCGIDLRDPSDLPTIIPAPKVQDPRDCCRKAGISELCMDLCALDVDIASVVEDPKYITCLTVFESLIQCGADGKDHRQCCNENGVKPFCYPFCVGKSPGSHITEQIQLLECVSESSAIFSCMRSGQKMVPYPPTGVEAIWWQAATSIQVRWSRPKFNHNLVQSYVVYYKSSSNPVEQHVGVNEHVLDYIIPNPNRSDRYEISVVATSSKGSSQRSNVATVEPLSLSPPTNIRYVVSGVSVTLTWTPPVGADSNVKYIVHYKKPNGSRYLKTQDIIGTTYTLTPLEPLTDYSAYVTSLSTKSYQSGPSQYVSFKTEDVTQPNPNPNPNPKAKGNKDGDDESDKVAIGVGVVVAIIAVIAIGVIVFVVLKGRGAFKSSNDTVAFENPIAGHSGGVKIQGMAGGTEEQFNYGRLEEDHIYDNDNNVATTSSPAPMAASFDGAYENPTYAGQEIEGGHAQDGAATLQVSSNA